MLDTEQSAREPKRLADRQECLFVVHGPCKGMTIPLGTRKSTLVGRTVGTEGVVLEDSRVSRLHFEIEPSPSGFRIRDLASRNGTFLNGVRLGNAKLEWGSVVRAGNSVLVYSGEFAANRLNDLLDMASRSDFPTLILGESGVGKEVVARKIHSRSLVEGPFVALNCGAVARDLLASELFGHVRGAFSGAEKGRDGLFRAASRGTILLDEIGDMPLDLQPTLLRVLEQRTVRPVGSDREVPIDVRILAATNATMPARVRDGRFRGDLYARLAHLSIVLPPLRERRVEILPLAAELGLNLELVHTDVAEALLNWNWPYNVRELKSVVAALALCASDGPVTIEHLGKIRPDMVVSVPVHSLQPSEAPPPCMESSATVLRDRVRLSLELDRSGGNVAALAKQLGTSRSHVYRWLRKWGIQRPGEPSNKKP